MLQSSNPSIPEESQLFEVTAPRGFLPTADPVLRLPPAFDAWEQVAGQLPKLLVAASGASCVDQMPVVDCAQCGSEADLHRAMLLLSYFACLRLGRDRTGTSHPGGYCSAMASGIAAPRPTARFVLRLLRPLQLAAAGSRRANRDSETSSCARISWAGWTRSGSCWCTSRSRLSPPPRLMRSRRAQAFAAEDRPAELVMAIEQIAAALEKMLATLARMPERCDPHIYYHRVRPYLYGWKDQPALPEGLVYEGVAEYQSRPQKFRGETGTQSSIIPSLDAALGISHASDPLRSYLAEMRQYMPPRHRAFIETLERGPAIRPYVLAHRADQPRLRDGYNACVRLIERFRSMHLEYAAQYIQHQSQHDKANPTSVGTGGTPFIPYLRKHRDETAGHQIH